MPLTGSTLDASLSIPAVMQPLPPVAVQREPASKRIPRRTFGSFCLCDTLLIFLLWAIYLSIIRTKNQTFMDMFVQQIKHYSFKTSLADIVTLSCVRDLILLLIYNILKFDHWVTAGFCAIASSAFLLAKVFEFPLNGEGQPVTYFLILSSFAMSWIATYLVDFKKLRSNSEFSPLYTPHEQTPRYDYPGQVLGMPPPPPENRSEFFSVAGSVVGEENRRVVSEAEGNADLGESERQAVINSHESYELGIRLAGLGPEEWKLEECGALGTSVHFKDVEDLGRVYKMEMIVPLSCEQLHRVLNDFREMPSWDSTLHTIELLANVSDEVDIIRIVTSEIEGKRNISKREFVIAMKTAKFEDIIYSFGSSIDYPPQDSESPVTRGEHKVFGTIIRSVKVQGDKCELVRFVATDVKGWIAQFRVDKAITNSLLKFAECLQNLAATMNNSRG